MALTMQDKAQLKTDEHYLRTSLNGQALYICKRCGSYVANAKDHDTFHRKHRA